MNVMKSTLIDRITGWFHAEPLGGQSDAEIGRLVQEATRDIPPDTHRRWLMLRNTITSLRQPQVAAPAPLTARILRPVLLTGILASALLTTVLLWRSTPVLDQTFSTSKGQMSTITLADSSDVVLNHTSEVLVAAMEPGKARTVRLKGEAYFKVRKNGSPFRVITPAGSVEVLGTEFNVRERSGAFEVAVLSGKVRVSVEQGNENRIVELTKGTILTVTPGDTSCVARELRFATYPGWLHNRLIFQDRPLASVCEELEDRFDARIRIMRTGAGGQRISGTLESRTLEGALASIATLTGLSIRQEADAHVLF
jgi:ferric-dicitrate binding protein FerR (iron transport regulator)